MCCSVLQCVAMKGKDIEHHCVTTSDNTSELGAKLVIVGVSHEGSGRGMWCQEKKGEIFVHLKYQNTVF